MELINISYTGTGVTPDDLSIKDGSLVTSNYIYTQFGRETDVIELHIYGENGDLLLSDYDASDYYPNLTANPVSGLYSSLVLDPEKDVKNRGFNRGILNAQYNFFSNAFNSSAEAKYWIKEISRSRTEIKLASQVIADVFIEGGFNNWNGLLRTRNYYPVFYLNFGNNQLVVANNVLYTSDNEGGYLLIKLYEPLPSQFDLKDQLWIVDKIAESANFRIDIDVQVDEIPSFNALRGPNYNVQVNNKGGQSTPYYNYNDLLFSPVTSSFQKLNSFYQDKAVAINVDYSNFSNFIKFSSAVERVNNFVYKLGLIETSKANIASQQSIVSSSSTLISQSVSLEQKAIDNIIKNFDTYEYFLYFESASWAWPKRNATQPYELYSVTSSQAKNFIGSENSVPTSTTASLLFSASLYDSNNKDILRNTAPQYLLDDPANQPFVTFLDMIGQHFDNLWIYYKDVTNRFNATNNPNTGISLDLVSDALKGLGFELFTNTNVSNNLYYTLFGINPDGSLLPPTGSEIITRYVTSSISTLPSEQIQDELYKRLYHNLPYLYKTKGTDRAIKALVSIYGIPEEILSIKEFGGNKYDSLYGVLDLNASDYKVNIATGSNANVTGSLTISSSLLSPYTTIQYYEGNTRLNNANIEVGFSPADVINNNITSSISNLNIDQLIGAPRFMYSSSYAPLVSASAAYFSSYTQRNSVWEYIRLLKFYNNSLFKSIKEFVPARANVSTGIIVKSHMLERNKYPRREPTVAISDYTQSIDMLDVSADNGGSITGSTYWVGELITPLGPVIYSSSNGIEKYTGELSGSEITMKMGKAFDQTEFSNNSISGSYVAPINYGALYQNVSSSVRSRYLLDIDYSSNAVIPVNFNSISSSISGSGANSSAARYYSASISPANPYAEVQDFNYNCKPCARARYEGAKVQSIKYNDYTAGDTSYGTTAAIDKIKSQYAYLVDIYTSSRFMPKRSNAQIKYIIDNAQNVLDLTKANKNIFDVQNLYKSGETVNVSLFDYDESNPYVQKLANNSDLAIYEGGWRYLPILHNVSKSSTAHAFTLESPIEVSIAQGSPVSPESPYLNPANYVINVQQCDTYTFSGESFLTSTWDASVTCSLSAPTTNISITIAYSSPINCAGACGSTSTRTVTILAGTTSVAFGNFASQGPCASAGGTDECYSSTDPCGTLAITNITAGSSGGGGGGSGSFYTYYTSVFSSSQSCLYYVSNSNEIAFNSTMSYYYYNNSPITFSSSTDIDWAASGLEPVVLPFTIAAGDKISLFDSASRLGWDERFEYTVKNVRVSGSTTSVTGSALLVEVVEPVNLALFVSGAGVPVDPRTGSPFRACRYIVWKHIPDETNVMLRYNPISTALVENGILFPQYIDKTTRDNSGNVIKALTQQNLI